MPVKYRDFVAAHLRGLTVLVLLTLAMPAEAVAYFLPSTAEPIENIERLGSITLPTGQYGVVNRPSEVRSGKINRQSWRVGGVSDIFSLFEALRDNIVGQGFNITLECASTQCGGFDFRYGIETTPPPDFLVDLQEFHYADFRKDEEIVTLLVSKVNGLGYVQFIDILPDASAPLPLEPAVTAAQKTELEPIPEVGAQSGLGTVDAVIDPSERQILSVGFSSGATTPSTYDANEFAVIAAKMAADETLTAYIVGHSDQSGGLAVNQSITRARANAVRQILINDYRVAGDRVLAEGVGFLAPIATNDTEEGRVKNRRIEIIYLRN